MKPIAYVTRLNEFYRGQGFSPYQWTINQTAPLTPLKKPLNRCRIALLTSGGVSRRDMAPFDPQSRNDLRVDTIDKNTSSDFFAINDDYYNHSDADRDINCIFPFERLRELAVEGVIGEVAPHLYSGFMGRIYIRSTVVNEAGPALVRKLRDESVDAFVLVPA
ncbi:MAG: glycine/sarcosine/betaine reductase selenoprotein B family protein [Candidatus Binataceae bacterium]